MAYRTRLEELEGLDNQNTIKHKRPNPRFSAGARGYGDSSKNFLETEEQEEPKSPNLRRANSRNSGFIEGYENLQSHSDMPAPIKEYTIQEIVSYLAGSLSSLKHYLKARHIGELYKPYQE